MWALRWGGGPLDHGEVSGKDQDEVRILRTVQTLREEGHDRCCKGTTLAAAVTRTTAGRTAEGEGRRGERWHPNSGLSAARTVLP